MARDAWDGADGSDPLASARALMVTEQLESRGIRDALTLAAMRLVPRERFLPAAERRHAYEDRAVPIGHGATISQPFMVARMTECLALEGALLEGSAEGQQRPRVLDVGTGSGYQAAVLAQMGAEVISIERDESLAESARERLDALGYRVEVVVGDGSLGYPPCAPYEAIVVAAAAPDAPPPLLEQLVDGGRLVIPIGPPEGQTLTIFERSGAEFLRKGVEGCVFIPLVGRHGYGG
jgi:protein-L-isoaspartate(D-aspartate) O-methyltransferase